VSHESTTAETLATSVAVAVQNGVVYLASAGTLSAGSSDGRCLRVTIR